ncbi:hypothetical protein GOB86_09320 [Acetobacter lambici]|uniref:Uncharacterized protein n=1 Tax=Acetobacter lambici TaxID=1332824 RepID=A0ABT1F5N3_9PROT|nr:hypothetical protein [Acetobacter lambici]MCP1242894.1 hypothetical protein [Acetobacter lambici]MCP1259064.1 hypothetical protein [Acetobacter lambici]NHO57257.1 hypothetical protein [Acetobacter lambici]
MKHQGNSHSNRHPKRNHPFHGSKQASDHAVWIRAAQHYAYMSQNDRRPGIRVWAEERAADCMDRADKACG